MKRARPAFQLCRGIGTLMFCLGVENDKRGVKFLVFAKLKIWSKEYNVSLKSSNKSFSKQSLLNEFILIMKNWLPKLPN